MSASCNLPMLDRTPPQSVELEMCVLGAIMLEPKEAYPVAADYLSPDSFYLEGHGTVFRLMGELFARGIPPDATSVLDELRSRGLLEKAGGSAVIMAMINRIPTAANVEYHSKKVAEKAMARALIHACTEIIDEAYRQELPVEQTMDQACNALMRLDTARLAGQMPTMAGVVRAYRDKMGRRSEALMEQRATGIAEPRIEDGVQTGLADLDRALGGLKPSQLIIIGARPKMGKTSLALTIAHHAAVERGVPTAVFSLEMGLEQLAVRMLAIGSLHTSYDGKVAGIGTERIEQPELSDREWSVLAKAYERLAAAPLYVDDPALLTVGGLRSRARWLTQHAGLKLLIVDYLQLMTDAGHEGRVQEVSAISRGLKQIARELHIPVVAPSQLSRQIEGRGENARPRLSDLRESGTIEQDADVVLLLHRNPSKETDSLEEKLMPTVEVNIAANRGGPGKVLYTKFFAPITRFVGAAPERR